MHLVLCSVFLFTCKTQFPVLTPKISASPSGHSALSFCSRAVWVWSCPVDVNLLLVLERVRAAGAVPVALPGEQHRKKGSESSLFSVDRAPLGKTMPGEPQEHWNVLLSQPKSSHSLAGWESSWAAPALLLELGQLGSRPVIPFICKILRSKESAPSAGKHCVCCSFNEDSASFMKIGIVTCSGICHGKPFPVCGNLCLLWQSTKSLNFRTKQISYH